VRASNLPSLKWEIRFSEEVNLESKTGQEF
jgi:hypothetical protein